MSSGLKVERINPGSIAAEIGMEPGDEILAVNGRKVEDLLDYRYLTAEAALTLYLRKGSGEEWLVDIEKDTGEDLGIEVEDFGNIRQCANKCLFCFVDQMPPGMRDSLYVKDDDYRHSFLFGNFITLTNVTPSQLERIAALKLSPLYVSVHTTSPVLRQKMMGNPRAGGIMEQLTFLARNHITLHTQVVLCPGINDGAELEKTVTDLSALWPAVQSLAVVPVGLTRYRRGLTRIKPFTADKAKEILTLIEAKQREMLAKFGSRFVFAADEFYLKSKLDVPPADHYEGFPQLENGVGLARQFLDGWQRAMAQKLVPPAGEQQFFIGTGWAAAPLLHRAAVSLVQKFPAVNIKVVILDNYFFGTSVTVAGLITGGDVLKNIMQKLTIPERKGGMLLLPDVMLKEGTELFLDNLSVTEVSRQLDMQIEAISTEPVALLAGLGFGGLS